MGGGGIICVPLCVRVCVLVRVCMCVSIPMLVADCLCSISLSLEWVKIKQRHQIFWSYNKSIFLYIILFLFVLVLFLPYMSKTVAHSAVIEDVLY